MHQAQPTDINWQKSKPKPNRQLSKHHASEEYTSQYPLDATTPQHQHHIHHIHTISINITWTLSSHRNIHIISNITETDNKTIKHGSSPPRQPHANVAQIATSSLHVINLPNVISHVTIRADVITTVKVQSLVVLHYAFLVHRLFYNYNFYKFRT